MYGILGGLSRAARTLDNPALDEGRMYRGRSTRWSLTKALTGAGVALVLGGFWFMSAIMIGAGLLVFLAGLLIALVEALLGK